MRKYLIIVLLPAILVLSSCTTGINSTGNSGLVANVPVWSSLGSLVKINNGDILDVIEDSASVNKVVGETNIKPTWVLYDISGRKTTNITPAGVVTRGGIAVSYLNPGIIWTDIGSYKGQIDGTFGVSNNYGKSWQLGVLPGISQPTPSALAAVSKTEAYFLLGIGRQRSIWVTLDTGNTFKEVLSAAAVGSLLPRNCVLNSITYVVQTLYMGTTCSSTSDFVVLNYRPNRKSSALTEKNYSIEANNFFGISFVENVGGNPVEIGFSSHPNLLIDLSGLGSGEGLLSVSYSLSGYVDEVSSFPTVSMNGNLLSIYLVTSRAAMSTIMTLTISHSQTISAVTSLNANKSVSDAILETQGHIYINSSSLNVMNLDSYSKVNGTWTEINLPQPLAPSIIANS